MDNNHWKRLITAINEELPFTPAYQLKTSGHPEYPDKFENEVTYLGDWSDECLLPYEEIEWVKIKPRMLKHIGRLVPKIVISVEEQVLAILHEQRISYEYDRGNIVIRNKKKLS